MTTRLKTWAQKIYDHRKDIASKMRVFNVSNHQFQVKEGGMKESLVNIMDKTCSCRVF